LDQATIISSFAAASLTHALARPSRAALDVFDNLEEARRDWLELERDAIATPYQTLAFVDAWTRAHADGRQPMIVVARDAAGRPNAILPLAIRRSGIGRVAEFPGGKDANFKMGLFRPDFALERDGAAALLRAAAQVAKGGVDLFAFTNQPHQWQGAANPLAVLRSQPSPSFGSKTTLKRDFDRWLAERTSGAARKKLRAKQKRLAAIGPREHVVARDDAGAQAIVDAFFAHKERRMRHAGFTGFGDPATKAFLAAVARKNGAPRPLMETHALMCGERIVATFCGAARGDRFCGMLISYDPDDDIARCSPGDLLLNHVVSDLCARGFATFDLGVGEARYKSERCEASEPLFDSFFAITPLGHAMGAQERLKMRGKRAIKQTPWAWGLANRLRGLRGALRDAGGEG
jgi:CelD/BcsL family acetyltransferase involved in cellulose biosynthesis